MPDRAAPPEPAIPAPPDGKVLICRNGATSLQMRLEGRTVWLSQRLIAELFQVSLKTVNAYLVNSDGEGELDSGVTIRNFRMVQTEGSRQAGRAIDHYRLNAILAVGERVCSSRSTMFYQWASAHLSELLVNGFTLDDERLEQDRSLGTDYFAEPLARIRDVLASEQQMIACEAARGQAA